MASSEFQCKAGKGMHPFLYYCTPLDYCTPPDSTIRSGHHCDFLEDSTDACVPVQYATITCVHQHVVVILLAVWCRVLARSSQVKPQYLQAGNLPKLLCLVCPQICSSLVQCCNKSLVAPPRLQAKNPSSFALCDHAALFNLHSNTAVVSVFWRQMRNNILCSHSAVAW